MALTLTHCARWTLPPDTIFAPSVCRDLGLHPARTLLVSRLGTGGALFYRTQTMTDTWTDINRRAAAVSGGVPWQNGIVLAEGLENMSGAVVVPGWTAGVGPGLAPGYIDTAEWSDDERALWVPDLSHAGTRGILREALGSPGIDVEHVPGRGWWIARLRWRGSYGLKTRAVRVPGDATREQAEAAALVALAEARGGWTPDKRDTDPAP